MNLERRNFIPKEEGDTQMTNAEIEATKTGSNIKKIARTAVIAAGTMLAAEDAVAETSQETQKVEQPTQVSKNQTEREKVNEFLICEENVKKLNEIEKEEYKKYILSEKGSAQEKELFNKLFDNNSKLKKEWLKLMSFSSDKNKAISETVMKTSLEIDKEIKQRKKECEAAGKNYFDRTPAPPELPDLF